MALTVVTGPPCSGKTTYVRERAQDGDVVIDFDNLAEAMGSKVRHGHSTAHQQITIAARRAAIEAAVRWSDRVDVWIVDCNVSAKRAQMYEAAHAQYITLSVDRDELHRRAHSERPRRWHKLIDEWSPRATGHTSSQGSREW